MCLIELKNSRKQVDSCSMNAKSTFTGTAEVFTNSLLARKYNKIFFVKSPVDCPICDQGGECDLQDQFLFFGLTKKRFYNYKRVVNFWNKKPEIFLALKCLF